MARLNFFLAETSATSSGLDSLLDPVGPILRRNTPRVHSAPNARSLSQTERLPLRLCLLSRLLSAQ
jgi:hypothetical protein